MPHFSIRISSFMICSVLFFISGFTKTMDPDDTGKIPSPLELVLRSEPFIGVTTLSVSSELTAYCTGPCCNSASVMENGELVYKDWSNKIAAGKVSMHALFAAGIEIAAVDTDIIPFGSIIRYQGKYYAALDRGFLIRGTKIDLAMNTHAQATQFGRKPGIPIEVYIPNDSRLALAIILSLAEQYSLNNKKPFY